MYINHVCYGNASNNLLSYNQIVCTWYDGMQSPSPRGSWAVGGVANDTTITEVGF